MDVYDQFKPMNRAIALIQSGHDPNTQQYGLTLLHVAADSDDIPAAKYLLENGANINELNNYGSTPLHYVLSSRRATTDIIKFLLDHGADRDKLDGNNRTLIERAHFYERPDFAQFIEEYEQIPIKGVHVE